MSLMVHVLTPSGVVWEAIAQSVTIPGSSGQFGILPGHSPLTTSIQLGVMKIRSTTGLTSILVMNGFAQVLHDEVVVLVNTAERGDEIDPQVAKADLVAATERLSQATDQRDRLYARRRVQRAKARLQAAIAL